LDYSGEKTLSLVEKGFGGVEGFLCACRRTKIPPLSLNKLSYEPGQVKKHLATTLATELDLKE